MPTSCRYHLKYRHYCKDQAESLIFLSIRVTMKKILVLHGPNLNRLGSREPSIYGVATLSELDESLENQAQAANIHLTCRQTNAEGQFIDLIHKAAEDGIDYLIVNAAAFTHTSIAIRDALSSVPIPFIEVHISNIYARESFRHHSYLSDIARGVISGLGTKGYNLALQAIIEEWS